MVLRLEMSWLHSWEVLVRHAVQEDHPANEDSSWPLALLAA